MLDARRVSIGQERQSRKAPLSDADAKALLESVSEVIIAKGKVSRRLSASAAKLADLKGPTGNYRAPMIRKGKILLVGFSKEALEALL